jgi:hypothetical protein
MVRRWFGSALVAGLVGLACANSDYTRVSTPVVLSMTDRLAPIGEGEDQLFEVRLPVPLQIRRGTNEEKQGLPPLAPYPRTPFYKSSDVRVTVRFTLSNLDDREIIVQLLVDPWNEFVRYDPGPPVVGEEEVAVNLSGIDRFIKIPPKGRVVGIITPDDFIELAKDLGTAQALSRLPPPTPDNNGAGTAGAGLYNRAFNTQNRDGENDPLLRAFVPAVGAGITGFDLGMRTGRAANISIEIVPELVEVSSDKRVVREDEPEPVMGRPGTVISPPPPEAQ